MRSFECKFHVAEWLACKLILSRVFHGDVKVKYFFENLPFFFSKYCVLYEVSKIVILIVENSLHISQRSTLAQRQMIESQVRSFWDASVQWASYIFILHSKFPIPCDTERVLSTNDRFTVNFALC